MIISKIINSKMYTILKNYKSSSFPNVLFFVVRHKSKEHWAKLKQKTSAKYKALNHFDDFYGTVYGKAWEPMKVALLRRPKYAALVNNYGDTEGTIDLLKSKGAHCLRELLLVQQKFDNQYGEDTQNPTLSQIENVPNQKMVEYNEKLLLSEITNVYPEYQNIPKKVDCEGENKREKELLGNIISTSKTLDQSMSEAKIDESRIIDPAMGLTTEALYQYVPATELKGMDDWVPESVHYSYYSTNNDFPLVVEPEIHISFPEHLKVYTYEMDSEWIRFPEPKRCLTGVFNYYPMDCGSVLAILALGISPGDRILDLCAAPGGKSLVALQTLLPDIIVCNDFSISRSNRLLKVFREYLCDFDESNKWRERVLITRFDGRYFTDDHGFDKVLVDAPCTNDRVSVMEDENNIFRPDRVKERLKIPEMQSHLLANALKLVKVGGSVVYTTCSLSPIQNDGVVHMALKQAFQDHAIVAHIKDLTPAMTPYSSTLKLCTGDSKPKYGQLVIPSVAANFGPTYIAKLVRVK